MEQLRLWYDTIDFWGKLKQEKADNVQVFYHFCGTPLPMVKR